MALRLRRGTDSQRQLITPVEGEMIYTTDTKELYVGDGITVGGIKISGQIPTELSDLSDIDITSSEPDLGQILRWDGEKFVPSNNEAVLEGENYYVNISKPDSSLIVDATNGILNGNLIGNVQGNVVGELQGSFTGSVFANDSTLIINGETGEISSESIQGTLNNDVVGDLVGSVFANDSTVLVDSISGTIVANVENQEIKTEILETAFLRISGETPFNGRAGVRIFTEDTVSDYNSEFTSAFTILSVHNDSENTSAKINIRGRGSIEIPDELSPVQEGDIIMQEAFLAISEAPFNTSPVAGVSAEVDGAVSPNVVPGTIKTFTSNSAGELTLATTVDSNQNLTVSGNIIANNSITNVIGSVYSNDSTQIIDGDTGSIVNLDFTGVTDNSPSDTVNVDSWLEVVVNGVTKYLPLYN